MAARHLCSNALKATVLATCFLAWLPLSAACPPEGYSRKSLVMIKASGFDVDDAQARSSLVLGLVDCLGDPDPAVRDGIAYAGLAKWMRDGELDESALRGLRARLYRLLDDGDDAGFARPFAALVLSEVARTDRVAPWMTPGERAAMVGRAADYVENVRDYRGFDNAEGWRHGVAHGADWLMQLALNPALDRRQLDRILSAVAVQAVPESAHAYVFGEPARLARPVLFVARRGLHSEAQWADWFAALALRLGDPALAWADDGWLVRRHDLSAFLAALYIDADRSEDPGVQALKPAVVAALKKLP